MYIIFCITVLYMFTLQLCTHTTGKEPMSATLPIKPAYPLLPTLDALFCEGPVSFAKLAAEASRRPEKKPHTFDFGVSSDDTDLHMTKESRMRLASFLEGTPEEVQQLMEIEFAKSREKAKKIERRKKPVKPKKIVDKIAEMKSAKAKEGTTTVNPEAPLSKDKPESDENSTDTQAAAKSSEDTATNGMADTKSKNRKTARDKFRKCENCNQEILERIQLCAGCKKVAYCNLQCQKTHWKQHKKTCSYAQKPSEKVPRCECCGKALIERVLMCAGCKNVAYCDSTCQRSHWKEHKKNCSYAQKKTSDTATTSS